MSQVEDRRTVESIRTRYAEMDGQAGTDVRFLLSVIDDIISVVARLRPRAKPRPATESSVGDDFGFAIQSRYQASDSQVAADVSFLLAAIERIRGALTLVLGHAESSGCCWGSEMIQNHGPQELFR